MLNAYAGIAFDYVAYVIDGNNDPIGLASATSLTATFTHIVSGDVVGPITGNAGTIGYATFPLTVSDVSEPGDYKVEITYTISAVQKTTFARPLYILQRPLPSSISVQSGVASLVKFRIVQPSGASVDITSKTVELYTQENHSGDTPALVGHNVVDAPSGLISASFTTSIDLFGHILVDSRLSTEFVLNPVV